MAGVSLKVPIRMKKKPIVMERTVNTTLAILLVEMLMKHEKSEQKSDNNNSLSFVGDH